MRLFARLLPQSLSGRIFALFATALVCFLGIGIGVFYRYEFTSGINDALDAAQDLSEVVTPTVTDSIVIGDYDSVERILQKAIRRSPFSSISLIDVGGGTLKVQRDLSYAQGAPEWLRNAVDERLADINNVISVGGKDYGVLRFRFAPDPIAADLWRASGLALALASAVLVAGLGAIRYSLRRWLEPLDRFGRADWSTEAQDDARLLGTTPIEIRQTLKAFARAGAELQVQRLAAAATLDAVKEGVITADAEGKIVYANPTAAQVLRVSGTNLLGRDLASVLPKGLLGTGARYGAQPWQQRRAEVRLPGGDRAIFDSTLAPIEATNGELIGQVLTFRDVTETDAYEQRLREELETRRTATQALREAIREIIPDDAAGRLAGSDTDLESIAHLFSDLVREREASHKALDNQKFALDQHAAVSISDARGTITYANEKFSQLSGYAIDELIGNNHRITASGLHGAAFYSEMWHTIASGRVWHGEFVNRHKDGSLYWVAATIVPWLDAEGHPYQYIAIRTDVTAQKRVERALEEARRREVQTGLEIQRSLLISEVPGGIRGAHVATRAEPSQGIDGDFCAFSTFGPDRFELLVGDVMGKGVPAALVGAALRMTYTQVVAELLAAAPVPGALPRPADIVNALHGRLTPRLVELNTFVTLALYRFDLASSTLTFVNAGHTPGLLCRQDGVVEPILGENVPVGILAQERYVEHVRRLSPGDSVVVYSDGLTEARDESGQQFGEDRLRSVLLEVAAEKLPPATCLDAVLKRSRDFVGDRPMSDDQTVAIVQLQDLPATGVEAPRLRPVETFELAWELVGLAPLRERIAAMAEAVGLDESASNWLVLGSFEAATNIVRHVRASRPSASLCCRLVPGPAELTVELWYVGPPYKPPLSATPDFSGQAQGGFGLYIIERAVSEVTYENPVSDVCCVRLVQRAGHTALAQ